jgi:hypothetical protein
MMAQGAPAPRPNYLSTETKSTLPYLKAGGRSILDSVLSGNWSSRLPLESEFAVTSAGWEL